MVHKPTKNKFLMNISTFEKERDTTKYLERLLDLDKDLETVRLYQYGERDRDTDRE